MKVINNLPQKIEGGGGGGGSADSLSGYAGNINVKDNNATMILVANEGEIRHRDVTSIVEDDVLMIGNEKVTAPISV